MSIQLCFNTGYSNETYAPVEFCLLADIGSVLGIGWTTKFRYQNHTHTIKIIQCVVRLQDAWCVIKIIFKSININDVGSLFLLFSDVCCCLLTVLFCTNCRNFNKSFTCRKTASVVSSPLHSLSRNLFSVRKSKTIFPIYVMSSFCCCCCCCFLTQVV